jgi:hypothetical protein
MNIIWKKCTSRALLPFLPVVEQGGREGNASLSKINDYFSLANYND